MTPETFQKIEQWAAQYETVRFIENDPIRVPHRYTDKRDIEISAFVVAESIYIKSIHEIREKYGNYETFSSAEDVFDWWISNKDATTWEAHRKFLQLQYRLF